MNNKCINLKQKFNQKLVCKKTNKEINIKQCNNCIYKEYKKYTANLKTMCENNKKHSSFHSQNAKLRKLERNRFSLFSNDTKHCIICNSTYKLTWHEIFRGKNRANSMRYGLCLRLCKVCHEKYQEDVNFNESWHKKGQAMFIKTYPSLDFRKIFKKSYL